MAKSRSLQARLTAPVGPLPVWGWAALILGAYLAWTRLHGGTTASSTAPQTPIAQDTNTTPAGVDTGNPPASGQGNPAGNVNDTLLSQLSGFQSSIDALTAAVQATPAPSGGSSGIIDWSGGGDTSTPTAPAPAPAPTVTKPAASPFGGVSSTKKLRSGATLITYRNGRQVEQVPGKKAYVVKR